MNYAALLFGIFQSLVLNKKILLENNFEIKFENLDFRFLIFIIVVCVHVSLANYEDKKGTIILYNNLGFMYY